MTVTTDDGRNAAASRDLVVETHDIAIVRLDAPKAASVGQTRTVSVEVQNTRYPERVEVQLSRGTPWGFEIIASSNQSVPVRAGGRTTKFSYSYTFTGDDAAQGKVTFRAVAHLLDRRDALPADNDAVSRPTRIRR
jgi:hypothetical protein